jgi:hypothetical protein
MPKGNATFMAQWLRVEQGQIIVYKTGLMASGMETSKVEDAIELLKQGEIVYLDPFEQLLGKVQEAWTKQTTQD